MPEDRRTLVENELYVIRSDGRTIWSELRTPPNVSPARGAQAGLEIEEYLSRHVLQRRSMWLGVIMDVRGGPSVFGPVTRASLERLFRAAQQSRKRIGVLVGASPVQQTQFSQLATECAPEFVHVADQAQAALDWISGAT
jgi:hypothetical protein